MRGPRVRLLLVLLVLTALTLTVADGQARTGPLAAVRRVVVTALSPLQSAGSAVVRALPGGRSGSERQLRGENDALRRRLLALEGAQAQAAELQQLLRLKDEGSYTTVLARVVGYAAATPFETTVTLDVGTRDGVRADQAVTDGRGLVGRTVRVGPDTCLVALLTDPTVTVGVRLNGAPRSFGLATGRGRAGLQLSLVAAQDVPAAGQTALHVGDALVTAGSDTYVPGLPVGRVSAVDPPVAGGVPTATVQPYADLASLDLLQVVVQGPAREPRVALPPS